LAFFQRSLAAAAILALASGLIFRRPLEGADVAFWVPFIFAHLARAPAAILALPAALIFLRPGVTARGGAETDPEKLKIAFS